MGALCRCTGGTCPGTGLAAAGARTPAAGASFGRAAAEAAARVRRDAAAQARIAREIPAISPARGDEESYFSSFSLVGLVSRDFRREKRRRGCRCKDAGFESVTSGP